MPERATHIRPLVRIYSVHLSLTVRLARPGHRARSKSTRVHLAVCAVSEDDARARAMHWFAQASTGPLRGPMFGTGLWDATEVRLAEAAGSSAVDVFASDSDVMVLS